MSALEKIIDEILSQADAQANGILNEAREKAAEILRKGEEDCEEMKRQTEETAEQECREIISRAQSADRQNRRLALLEVRNQVIDEVIAEAKANLLGRQDKEKFKIIEQGNIILNNSIDAVFESEGQTLRDKAYEVLTADA